MTPSIPPTARRRRPSCAAPGCTARPGQARDLGRHLGRVAHGQGFQQGVEQRVGARVDLALVFCGLVGVHDQHELALLAVRVGGQPGRALAQREGGDFLEALGQLARHGQLARRAADLQQVRQRGGQPVRRLEHHHRRRQRAPGAQPALARGRLGRRETGEGEGGILVGCDAAAHQGRDDRAGARHRHHRVAGLAHGADHARARIADGRRAGVGHQRHALALGQALADRLRGRGFVVPMGGHERRAHAPGVQQLAAGRVSSAAITSARCRACQARRPRSPRLPMGVATTYSVAAGQCWPATLSATRLQASPAAGETF